MKSNPSPQPLSPFPQAVEKPQTAEGARKRHPPPPCIAKRVLLVCSYTNAVQLRRLPRSAVCAPLRGSAALAAVHPARTPLPSTRQLKRIHSRAKKTPPHTRGGIRANKTQNPPFSHTPKSTRMKILPFLTPLNTHIQRPELAMLGTERFV